MSLSAFDTNVLAYAVGLATTSADRPKVALAAALLVDVAAHEALVVPVQVCLEFHHILIRKGGMPPGEAARMIETCIEGALVVPTDFEVVRAALELSERHKLQTYDAVILAAAARVGCELLFSEDMHNGFEWSGVRVVNPFA